MIFRLMMVVIVVILIFIGGAKLLEIGTESSHKAIQHMGE